MKQIFEKYHSKYNLEFSEDDDEQSSVLERIREQQKRFLEFQKKFHMQKHQQ